MAFTKDEAIVKLKEWADAMEVMDDTADFQEACETLCMAVMRERLAFNDEDRSFSLKLFDPIQMEKSRIELIKIRRISVDEMRVAERYTEKEKVSSSEAVIAKACGLKLAESSKLMDKDIATIGCVRSTFFV
jgi:hypothetical protein